MSCQSTLRSYPMTVTLCLGCVRWLGRVKCTMKLSFPRAIISMWTGVHWCHTITVPISMSCFHRCIHITLALHRVSFVYILFWLPSNLYYKIDKTLPDREFTTHNPVMPSSIFIAIQPCTLHQKKYIIKGHTFMMFDICPEGIAAIHVFENKSWNLLIHGFKAQWNWY